MRTSIIFCFALATLLFTLTSAASVPNNNKAKSACSIKKAEAASSDLQGVTYRITKRGLLSGGIGSRGNVRQVSRAGGSHAPGGGVHLDDIGGGIGGDLINIILV
jgi:hypothetical protein